MTRILKRFQDLLVWQKAHLLVLQIYNLSQSFPAEEKFGLTSQIRRASVSVASNIVEGFRRKSVKDSLHFYNIADGSLEELKYQLLLTLDLNFINNDGFKKAMSLSEEVSKMLYFWAKSQKNIKT